MNPELERLIDFAIADGILTDKEKAILYKKAKELDVDIDEFEMILNGKLHIKQKEMQQEANVKATPTSPVSLHKQQQSNKEGDLKKCPSCGAPVVSFATKCSSCGHEFRNIQASNSVKELSIQLQNAAERIRKEKENMVVTFHNAHLKNPLNIAKEIATLQESIISSFPVPNTKEDILEFLSIALPEAKKKSNTMGGYVLDGSDGLKNAWLAKCEQVIMKAKFSMKDDKKLLEEIEFYSNQLSTAQQQNKSILGKILNTFKRK